MTTATLWICAAPAPNPLSPFLPNSHLTFILRTQKKPCELPPFTVGWKVCLWATPGHLMCVLHALRWGTLMNGLHRLVRRELSICWGWFCLRPSLRAKAYLGAARRLFCSLGVGLWAVPEVGEEVARSRQSEAAEPEVTAPHEMWSFYLKMDCPDSPVSVWALLTGIRRKHLSQHILRDYFL